MDKNKAMIEFLLECPTIQENPLFFNFANEEAGNNHFITETDNKKRTFVDGSELRQYTFTIASYSAISHNAVIQDGTSLTILNDENIENMAKIQAILDWIEEQAHPIGVDASGNFKAPHYPDFGTNCRVDSMELLTSDPDTDGIDTSVNPPIARYSVGVRLTYLDTTKKIWN